MALKEQTKYRYVFWVDATCLRVHVFREETALEGSLQAPEKPKQQPMCLGQFELGEQLDNVASVLGPYRVEERPVDDFPLRKIACKEGPTQECVNRGQVVERRASATQLLTRIAEVPKEILIDRSIRPKALRVLQNAPRLDPCGEIA
ncbi:MAG TPA: hypothetical protein VMY37_29995 [Thermoguttaceae bacterium]|nr:hypothetical protein [Thermoguttaceae bacterium]